MIRSKRGNRARRNPGVFSLVSLRGDVTLNPTRGSLNWCGAWRALRLDPLQAAKVGGGRADLENR
jgi:hypothetical protein